MEKKRSIGVIVIGLGLIILHFVVFFSRTIPFSVLFTLIFIIIGLGILNSKNWARIMFILVMPAYLLFNYWLLSSVRVAQIARGIQPTTPLSDDIFLFGGCFVLYIISIYYLTRLKVKEQFK